MKKLGSCLYSGGLLHRRYRPRRHELRYDVINLFVDVDELPALSKKSWFFGYNRFSLFSVQDRNHGGKDGEAIAPYVRKLMSRLDLDQPAARIFMFCYPAVLGRVFNPLTVYFGFGANGQLVAVVYEVNNTFGQRHSYALAVAGEEQHRARKEFYVSPFNPADGEYRFDCRFTDENLRLNIALFEGQHMKLCARFEGERIALSDWAFAHSLLSLIVQPLKVIAGIHWEALKLYIKGLRPFPRPDHEKFALTVLKVKS